MTVAGVDGTGGAAESWIPGLDATQARDLSVWSAFPLLLGGGTSGHAFWLQIEPIDVTHHRVTWHLLAHPDRMLEAAEIDTLLADDHRGPRRGHEVVPRRPGRAGVGPDRGVPAHARSRRPVADFQRWIAGRLGRAI